MGVSEFRKKGEIKLMEIPSDEGRVLGFETFDACILVMLASHTHSP